MLRKTPTVQNINKKMDNLMLPGENSALDAMYMQRVGLRDTSAGGTLHV